MAEGVPKTIGNRLKTRAENLKRKGRDSSADTSALVCEGKWDVTILRTAWMKLYSSEIPFRIISCDTTPRSASNSSAGASVLKACLESARPEEPIQIGLFDRDREGMQAYSGLSKNFILSDTTKDSKIQANGSSAAISLPDDGDLKKYAEYQNSLLSFFSQRSI